MKKELVQLKNIQVMGFSIRTNNANEMNPNTAKIGKLVNRYRCENLGSCIPHSVNPGIIFSIYTDYASNEKGDYTYLIGEEVADLEDVPEGMTLIEIPAGKYQKFTTSKGQMPEIVIKAWQEIWQMTAKDLGGERAFKCDFEIYDKRAIDPENTVVDLYIGIK